MSKEPQEEDEESPDDSPQPATQRRREQASPEDDAFNGDGGTQADSSQDQMVKKLVRLALASEYQRRPIRRADISEKVLGSQGRQFKAVFERAQTDLQAVFGMELRELPAKDKVTLQQRRGEIVLFSTQVISGNADHQQPPRKQTSQTKALPHGPSHRFCHLACTTRRSFHLQLFQLKAKKAYTQLSTLWLCR